MQYTINIVKISCGFEHTLLLSEMGNVYGLGSNIKGQLGLGSIDKRIKPSKIDFGKKEKIWKIAAGGYHSLVSTIKLKRYEKCLFFWK